MRSALGVYLVSVGLLLVGILLESMLRYCETLSQVILIRRRSSGRGSLLKDQIRHHPTNRSSSDGRTTAQWFLGNCISYSSFLVRFRGSNRLSVS